MFNVDGLQERVRYLESADDEQSVDVVDPHLLGDLIQMFPWKSSGGTVGVQVKSSLTFHPTREVFGLVTLRRRNAGDFLVL